MRSIKRGFAVAGAICALGLPSAVQADVVVRGEEGKPLSEIRKAPASIYPDLQTIVAQPSPSEVKPEFLGPVVMMKSAHIDLEKGTATLPLRKGKLKDGTPLWFIITDTPEENLSNLHGVNYAPKMAYALTGKGSRSATLGKDGVFTFASGNVDFKPVLGVTPGLAGAPFPPTKFQPGSVGDATYTPMVFIENSAKAVLINAPVLSQATEAELRDLCACARRSAVCARRCLAGRIG